ncbi:MAG: 2-polyprenyl-3-methyl-6-methoxy-1,4-benzoquinone monooxygenase [Oxalobacteraceae bacterium]
MIDELICAFDRGLRAVSGVTAAYRANPAQALPEAPMSDAERKHSAGLMRVNHVGEVCAQALYEAQALFAQSESTRQQFRQAGREELDHLAWTAQRLRELESRPSLLNPLWYAGAFAMGAIAARAGDANSLGFVVETERQVEAHLNGHLDKLPEQDQRSRAIVTQMRDDEIEHGDAAKRLGGIELPSPVQSGMRAVSRIMTGTAYYF